MTVVAPSAPVPREEPSAGENSALLPSVLRVRKIVVRAAGAISAFALLLQLALLTVDVVGRATFGFYFSPTLELSNLTMAILTFGGAILAQDRGQHVALGALVGTLPPRGRVLLATVNHWISAFTSGLVAIYSIPVLIQRADQLSPILQWPESIFLAPLTVGLAFVSLHCATLAFEAGPRIAAVAGLAVLALIGVVVLATSGLESWNNGWSAIAVQLGVFVVLLLGGLPVAFGLALASIAYLHASGIAGPVAAVINMSQGATNFLLLAIPFFVLSGGLMSEGGLSRRLAESLRLLVGRLHGGLHHVLVIGCFIFSGMSGAKIADIVAVGTPLKRVLDSEGYPRAESAAVLAASAVAAETIPPSIAMLVLASVTSVSVASMFIAGILPAAVISISLMLLIYVKARRSGFRQPIRVTWLQKLQATWPAFPAFLIPVIIAGGIISGLATPTEVSAVAVVVCLAWSIFYREMSWRQFGDVLIDSIAISGMVLFLVSAASAFSWSFAIADVPNQVGVWLRDFTGSRTIFFILSFGLLILMGALLEGLPAIIVFAPLLEPTAVRLGIDPLQFGIVLIIAMGIGAFLPPIGAGVYIAAAVIGANPDAANRAMIPYMVILILSGLLIVLIPSITLALPQLLGSAH